MSEYYDLPMNTRSAFTKDGAAMPSDLLVNSSLTSFGLGLVCAAKANRRVPAMCFAAATPAEFFNVLELNDISDVNYGVLAILALSSLSVYGLIIAG